MFEDCQIGTSQVLGEIGSGVKVLMSGLDYERAVLSGGPVGILQACLDTVLPYVHDREQFGQPIGEFQLVQGKLADMYARCSASRAYLYAVCEALDRGENSRKDAAAVILYTAEAATQSALDAIQLLGGNGYINDYPTGRLFAMPSFTRLVRVLPRSDACWWAGSCLPTPNEAATSSLVGSGPDLA